MELLTSADAVQTEALKREHVQLKQECERAHQELASWKNGKLFQDLSAARDDAQIAFKRGAEQRVSQLTEAETKILKLEAELLRAESDATSRCEAAEARAAAAVQQAYEVRKELSRRSKPQWNKGSGSPTASRVLARRMVSMQNLLVMTGLLCRQCL